MDIVYVLIIISFAITVGAQIFINCRYNKYLKIENGKELSGLEVAQKILKANGLDNVYVVETKGILSDHFDPGANVVRLSSAVYNSNSVSSAAIAAHEVGHCIKTQFNNRRLYVPRIYSLRYLNGKGTTVSLPLRTNATFISGSILRKSPLPVPYCSTHLIRAAFRSADCIPLPHTPTK